MVLLSEWLILCIALISMRFIWEDVWGVFRPKLLAERSFQHLTFATILSLFLLWSAQAGIKEQLNIHFLALTSLTLMYGARSAYAIAIIITTLLTLFGQLSLSELPSYLIVSCLIPIVISHSLFMLSYRYLPRNVFVFIFVAGFFNGALTGSAHLLVNAVYQYLQGSYDWQTVVDNYLIFMPLIAFPEALLNGMTMAMLTVFKPEWLRVFSDRDYIYNHSHKK
nr:energy-coupling factor ABC transporter permease [Vibrio ostreicida]